MGNCCIPKDARQAVYTKYDEATESLGIIDLNKMMTDSRFQTLEVLYAALNIKRTSGRTTLQFEHDLIEFSEYFFVETLYEDLQYKILDEIEQAVLVGNLNFEYF